jgi:hypothetical protein
MFVSGALLLHTTITSSGGVIADTGFFSQRRMMATCSINELRT